MNSDTISKNIIVTDTPYVSFSFIDDTICCIDTPMVFIDSIYSVIDTFIWSIDSQGTTIWESIVIGSSTPPIFPQIVWIVHILITWLILR